jgi:biotin--protein ligase
VHFGKHLLYGDVLTSTTTILEKHIPLLKFLPSGFTVNAREQTRGRGRGNNVWVSAAGTMMFSTIIKHQHDPNPDLPRDVTFIQYLAALAVVIGIHKYGPGYHDFPVKLKWPNDVYAKLPLAHSEADGSQEGYTKIGGVLVTTPILEHSYYTLVVGVGVNVTNAGPTKNLNEILVSHNLPLKPFQMEKLLASVLISFEDLYRGFCDDGWDGVKKDYHDNWLHTGQIVTLESKGGVRARIKEMANDGTLCADEVDGHGTETGISCNLQSDQNSFDFFKGLIKTREHKS